MLKKETQDKFKAIGLDLEKLKTALTSSEEVDYEFPDVQVFTAEQLTTRDANLTAEAKKLGVSEGKDAGLSIASKELAKKFNLTIDNPKDLNAVVDKINETLSTGDKGLKEQIALLTSDRDKAIQEKEQAINQVKQVSFDTSLLTSFPTNRSKVLNDNEYLNVVKANLQFEEVDGVQVVKRNGEVLRDEKTRNPLQPKEAINVLFAERKWIEAGGDKGGRGGSDSTAGQNGGIKTFSKAVEKWKAENPDGNTLSPAFQSYLETVAKETTDFDYNS